LFIATTLAAHLAVRQRECAPAPDKGDYEVGLGGPWIFLVWSGRKSVTSEEDEVGSHDLAAIVWAIRLHVAVIWPLM